MLLEPSGFLAVCGAGTPNLFLNTDKQSLLSFPSWCPEHKYIDFVFRCFKVLIMTEF